MTPARLDPDVVRNKLSEITRTLDALASVEELTAERLRNDAVVRAAVERFISRTVDLAVDVTSHISVATLGRAPGDYRESFRMAGEAGAIDTELAERLAPSVGMRNVIIHEYERLDLERLAAAVPLALEVYREYVRHVARFVLEQTESG